MAGIILVNPSAGSDETGPDAIRAAFEEHEVVECDPERMAAALDAAAERDDIDFIGMAGGDGSMRSVAHRLGGTKIPLLVIPAGTRNHLAKDLGIIDLDTARDAAANGRVRTVDLGEVNGETFVNNLSIGAYPKMVLKREHHERAMPKPLANLIAAFDQLRNGHRTRIAIGDTELVVWAVFIGNGQYGDGLTTLIGRESLDGGQLDVRIVRADRRFARLRVTLSILFGRLGSSPTVERLSATHLTLTPKHRVIDAALDGEVMQLSSPLDVRCEPGGLTVLVPVDHSVA